MRLLKNLSFMHFYNMPPKISRRDSVSPRDEIVEKSPFFNDFIIYEDESIIVADKPSGMLVIPTDKKERHTLTSLLNSELDRRGVQVNAYPCHRIDRETSGLVIFAKGKKNQKLMMDEFRKRAVKKVYTAFVHGRVERNSDTIKKPIFNKSKKRYEEAATKYSVLERRGAFTVVEAEPITGRTNQIRIHFKEIGHPIVGESVYAFRKDFKLRFRRTALHARELRFHHPVTGRRLHFTSPLPEDMAGLLD